MTAHERRKVAGSDLPTSLAAQARPEQAWRSPERCSERRVAELETLVAVLLDRAGIARPRPAQPEVAGEILDLMRRNETIHAIKRYREIYGVGLAEAKEAVDRLRVTVR
jgi:ribosomal protein L7/L12